MASESKRPDEGDIGSFVRTDLGFGRLAAIEAETAHVRFLKTPGVAPYVDKEFRLDGVVPSALPAHTRAYAHDGRRWRIGRVDGVHPQDPRRYLIAFPNSDGEIMSVDDFDVRWDVKVDDPFEVLAAVGGDSPLVYDSRLGVLSSWAAQRANGAGVEGLLLGSVELHRHQLNVVRRVSGDPVRRYLLADEVGLGKTIEASALIWQFLRDNPSSRVLVVAPEHLREQWGRELINRFRMNSFSEAWIRIRSQEDPSSWPADPVDLLVIDEAHHVTRTGRLTLSSRERLGELAHAATSLLLLSATPVRSNEAGFLDLLHLLDPEHYRPDQLEEFTTRVELRDQLALTYQALEPTIDEFDLSLYADELRALFPADVALDTLLSDALSASDDDRPSRVRRLRDHLSASYRLHHRLLRTRRSSGVGADFSVRGRTRAVPFTVEVSDPTSGLRRELLDSVRGQLVAAIEREVCTTDKAVDVFRNIAARCGSLAEALRPLAAEESPDPEIALLQEFSEEDTRRTWQIIVEDIGAMSASVLNDLGEALSRVSVARAVPRVVFASGFTETASVVAEEMRRRWGADRVAAHLESRTESENNDEVSRWRADGPCSVLVCDGGAEEGINLQEADLLVHLDLPWDVFRIEQRIGRCDRHAPTGAGAVPSSVVALGDLSYSLGWFEFVADGCRVFSESVSSLQYVLGDTERAIQSQTLQSGPEALIDAVDSQAETLAQERTRIVAHDALDAIDLDDEADVGQADEALLANDRDHVLGDSLLAWLEGVGTKIRRPAPGTIRLDRRPRPQVAFDVEIAMAPHFETELALDRHAASSRGSPILRAGHPLVDSIAEHLHKTDRGIAFATFRPARGQWPPVTVFRTDFLVSFQAIDDTRLAAGELGFGDWLDDVVGELAPPRVESLFITNDGEEVTHPGVVRPYDKQKGDRNLGSRPNMFERLTQHLDWEETCARSLERATAKLGLRAAVIERPGSLGEDLRRRVTQLADRERARRGSGLELDERDWEAMAALSPWEFRPVVEVLGCGAILIGDPAALDRD